VKLILNIALLASITSACSASDSPNELPTITVPTISNIIPDTGLSDSDFITHDSVFTIQGKSGVSADIELTVNNEIYGSTTADSTGAWRYDLDLSLSGTGDYEITVATRGNGGSFSIRSLAQTISISPAADAPNNVLLFQEIDGSNGFIIAGTTNGQNLGEWITKAGDFDGDGIGDFIFSELDPTDDTQHRTIFYGSFGLNPRTLITPEDIEDTDKTLIPYLAIDNFVGCSYSIQSDTIDIDGDFDSDLLFNFVNTCFGIDDLIVYGGQRPDTLRFNSLNSDNSYRLIADYIGDFSPEEGFESYTVASDSPNLSWSGRTAEVRGPIPKQLGSKPDSMPLIHFRQAHAENEFIASHRSSNSIPIGDLDDDGVVEMINSYAETAFTTGTLREAYCNGPLSLDSTAQIFESPIESASSICPTTLQNIDFDNNGRDDLIIQASPTIGKLYSYDTFGTISKEISIEGLRDLSKVGDFNGDGIEDIGYCLTSTRPAILFGSESHVDNISLLSNDDYGNQGFDGSSLDYTFGIEFGTDHVTCPIGIGDINGDSFDDIAISDPSYDNYKGRIIVVYGSAR